MLKTIFCKKPRSSKAALLLSSVLLLCINFLTASVFASDSLPKDQILPKSFKAVYKANYSGFDITATRELKQQGDDYSLSFNAKSWFAKIDEESVFQWGDHGQIIPQKYTYDRSGLGKKRQALLTFDWSKRKVQNQVQDSDWSMDLPEVALDKLSYQLQLRKDLLNQQTLGAYEIADGGRLKVYTFEVIGEETIETPLGLMETVHIKRIRKGKKRFTHIWLAKEWDYLIVKLEHKEKSGQSFAIELAEATVGNVIVSGLKP